MVSLRARISGTLALVVGWLITTILFTAFYPTGFDFWQNLAVFIVSALIVFTIVAIIWITMMPI
jgi:uncharacterized membrane protein YhdT